MPTKKLALLLLFAFTAWSGPCMADDNAQLTPDAHGQMLVGQPRKESHGSLFGEGGVFSGKNAVQTRQTVQPYSSKAQGKAPTGKSRAAAKAGEQPVKPVDNILLVPENRDNGHGMPIAVYKKYHY